MCSFSPSEAILICRCKLNATNIFDFGIFSQISNSIEVIKKKNTFPLGIFSVSRFHCRFLDPKVYSRLRFVETRVVEEASVYGEVDIQFGDTSER